MAVIVLPVSIFLIVPTSRSVPSYLKDIHQLMWHGFCIFFVDAGCSNSNTRYNKM